MTNVRGNKRLQLQPNVSQASQPGQQPPSRCERNQTRGVSSTELGAPSPKRLRLTEGNLKKHGRLLKGLDKIRSSGTTSTVTTTDKQFGDRLTANGVVYESNETCPPKDEVDLVAFLKDQTPPEGSKPSRESWERMKLFKKHGGGGEMSLDSMVVEAMLTAHDRKAPFTYSRFRNEQWTEVDSEITAGIPNPKPNIMETFFWKAYPAQTREDFVELVISQYAHAMPTFVIESKGPTGDHEQAVRQAAYDGAIMTHAALAIDGQLERSSEIRFKTTKAITVTLSTTHIHVYANHAVKDLPGSKTAYHQHHLLEVKYIASEAEWTRAHTVIFNAQRLGLRLAQSRVKDLEEYYDSKEGKDKTLKAQQIKLQAHAFAKSERAMALPPLKRRMTPSIKPVVPQDQKNSSNS